MKLPKINYLYYIQPEKGFFLVYLEGNVPSSKTNRQLVIKDGKPISFPSTEARKWMKNAVDALKYIMQDQPPLQFQFPVDVFLYFIRKDRRRFDYINAAQTVLDALVKAGVLPDDGCYTLRPVFGGHEVNKEQAGVIICITNQNPLQRYAMASSIENLYSLLELKKYDI